MLDGEKDNFTIQLYVIHIKFYMKKLVWHTLSKNIGPPLDMAQLGATTDGGCIYVGGGRQARSCSWIGLRVGLTVDRNNEQHGMENNGETRLK